MLGLVRDVLDSEQTRAPNILRKRELATRHKELTGPPSAVSAAVGQVRVSIAGCSFVVVSCGGAGLSAPGVTVTRMGTVTDTPTRPEKDWDTLKEVVTTGVAELVRDTVPEPEGVVCSTNRMRCQLSRIMMDIPVQRHRERRGQARGGLVASWWARRRQGRQQKGAGKPRAPSPAT